MAHIANIDQLKDHADLVAIASRYTRLKKQGGRSVGRCPFHDEKSASFSVGGPGGRNLFKCFGCGVGGDAIKFVQDIEGLSFIEAVERLAILSGFTLTYEQQSGEERKRAGLRSRIAAANAELAGLYQELLRSDVDGARKARDYLTGRGFTAATLEVFGIGWTPEASDTARQHLHAKGFDDELLLAAGIIRRLKNGRIIDAFRSRVMFPIADSTGTRIIAFAGRALDLEDGFGGKIPKYVNTAETELYKKTEVLYGFGVARKSITKADEAIIVEGYTDVMACHQAGFHTVVAACGTAIGSGHMRQLGRVADIVTVMADGDEAGRKAAVRAWDAAQGHGVGVRVAVLPQGRDPADLAAEGAAAVMDVLGRSIDGFEHAVSVEIGGIAADDARGRARRLHAAVGVLGRVGDVIERIAAVDSVAAATGFEADAVRRAAQEDGVDLTAAPSAPQPPVGAGQVADVRRKRIEAHVLWVALNQPELFAGRFDEVVADDFMADAARQVFDAVTAAGGPGAGIDRILEAAADDEVRSVIGRVALSTPPSPCDERSVARLVEALTAARARRAGQEVKQRLARLRDDPEAAAELLAEQQMLLNRASQANQ